MKKCPFCAEKIQDEAIKCKHCGEKYPVPKNKKDVWYRIIKVLYFFFYTILICVILIGFFVAFTEQGLSKWDGLGFSLGIIGGIIGIEIVNLILVYLFKGDIKETDYCILLYRIKGFFVFILALLFLAVSSIGYISFKEYQEQLVKQEAYKLGAKNDDDVEKYKELKEDYDSVDLPQAFRSTLCGNKGYRDLFTNVDNTSDTLTFFYDLNSNDCYLLREYNSHGGNGLIRTTLYSLETKEVIGTRNNHVSDDVFFAGDNLVYANRIDDLLSEINLSRFWRNQILGNNFARGDIIPEWENTYEKVLELRGLDNYKEKKAELYETEEIIKDRSFIWRHYVNLTKDNFYVSHRGITIGEGGKLYNNYLNPKVSYETFKGWYQDVYYTEISEIEDLTEQKYKFTLTLSDEIEGDLQYELIVEIERLEDGSRKIKDYESKKI